MNMEINTYTIYFPSEHDFPHEVTICTRFFTGPLVTTWVAWEAGTEDAEQYGNTEAEAIGCVFMAMAESHTED